MLDGSEHFCEGQSCGQVKNSGEVRTDIVNNIPQSSKEADGTGRLIIQKTSDGYDISDYESESSYRFLADSSNIESIENNKIYIKYPEKVLSDDTVDFSYYILEYDTDGIDVYYGKTTR